MKIGWKECSLEGLMLIYNASFNANKGLIIIRIICSLIQRIAFCVKQIYASLQSDSLNFAQSESLTFCSSLNSSQETLLQCQKP